MVILIILLCLLISITIVYYDILFPNPKKLIIKIAISCVIPFITISIGTIFEWCWLCVFGCLSIFLIPSIWTIIDLLKDIKYKKINKNL